MSAPTPSRRTFVGHLAGALAATGIVYGCAGDVLSASPALGTLAETFFACDAEYRAFCLEDREEDEVQDACDRRDAALDAVVEAKTFTRDDILTKARVLKVAMELEVPQFLGTTVESAGAPHELLAYSICQDLARLG